MTRFTKPGKAILALPRSERRKKWLAARRGWSRYSPSWTDYRRWDGGTPNILGMPDLLRMKAERKAMARKAAIDSIVPEIRAAGILAVLRSRLAARVRRSP